MNADRATLTTGKPMVGPDGGIGFDVAGGKLRVEGAGLNGANLSRVDLMARTLEINAGIWADQLHVTAGAAKVDMRRARYRRARAKARRRRWRWTRRRWAACMPASAWSAPRLAWA